MDECGCTQGEIFYYVTEGVWIGKYVGVTDTLISGYMKAQISVGGWKYCHLKFAAVK